MPRHTIPASVKGRINGKFAPKYTPDMDRLILEAAALRDTLTDKALAVKLGVTYGGIRYRLRALREERR